MINRLPKEVVEVLEKCLRALLSDLEIIREDRRRATEKLNNLNAEEIQVLLSIKDIRNILDRFGVDVTKEDNYL